MDKLEIKPELELGGPNEMLGILDETSQFTGSGPAQQFRRSEIRLELEWRTVLSISDSRQQRTRISTNLSKQ
jgi:hypothetical protein